jgi:hypothetical protein
MRRYHSGYLAATRHPWACLLFLLPLLLAYEAGILWLGGAQPDALRNGADTWLRWGLEAFGFRQLYAAPVLIVAVFLGWSWLRFWDRPEGMLGIGVGMALESLLLAIGLWALSRGLGPLFENAGMRLSVGPSGQSLAQVVTFVGAGIYEEVLFRLILFFVLGLLLRQLAAPRLVAALLITVTSALIFAGAHHMGPYGEAFDGRLFFFRILAGCYFALVYQLRGFGVAVGSHACYDVLVGVLLA